MKLIKPSYEIITPINGEEILKQIELAARTCYKSEDKIEYSYYNNSPDVDKMMELNTDLAKNILFNGSNKYKAVSARHLIEKLISRGHEAMLEFGGMIAVKFICDRGISHELVRHRVASFAQESTRYCNYSKDEHIQFIIPNWIEDLKEGIYNDVQITTNVDEVQWLSLMLNAEHCYNNLINQINPITNKIDLRCRKWSPQEARSVLPNSLKTEINVSANIREWRHIFKLRTATGAHPQLRELMCPLLDEFKTKIPILFDDINC